MPKYAIGGRSRRNGITFYEGNTAFRYSKKTGRVIKIPFYNLIYGLQVLLFVILVGRHKKQIIQILAQIIPILDRKIEMNNISITSKIYFFSLTLLIGSLIELILLIIIGRFSGVFRIHASEHKVIEFYKEKGRVPTLEEARKQSSFANSCGSTYVAVFICILATSVCLHSIGPYMPNEQYFTFLYVLGILLASGFFYFLKKKTNFMCFLQIFVLQKPDDKTLEDACIGMQAVIDELDKRKRKA